LVPDVCTAGGPGSPWQRKKQTKEDKSAAHFVSVFFISYSASWWPRPSLVSLPNKTRQKVKDHALTFNCAHTQAVGYLTTW